ncbi:MAG TPA: tripartite tricarboxylate transporter substrate binding protein [Burkholderiales bacterium]|jgi:tripartite-type tricarboxylate transporter receptor subunit TctC|nr:tripartite tricarboxylate transporter substrate binding protein [Burkholderiales bacterium]
MKIAGDKIRARAAACLLGAIACGSVFAQEANYPERPIHLIVGFPPGGPNDLIARIIQPKLGELLKQTIIIENRNGSNGEIATGYVAKAAPDGYTMLVASNGSITISPGLGKKLPYDSRKDLTPLTIVAASPMLLVVPLQSEAKSVADVIAMAKANPGKLSSASAGAAGPTHLALELFKSLAHVEIAHIPYKGGGPALTDAMGGQVDMYFGGLSTALPHVRAGKLRGLGVTTLARSAIAPEIPTIAETVPGYDASIWYGTFAPPGLPAAITAKLHDAIVAAVRSPEVLGKLKQEGVDPMDNSSAQLAAFIREDIDKWARLAKSANIKPE